MHTFKKKKSDEQKDDMRFLTLVNGNFHGILHHVIPTIDEEFEKWTIFFFALSVSLSAFRFAFRFAELQLALISVLPIHPRPFHCNNANL